MRSHLSGRRRRVQSSAQQPLCCAPQSRGRARGSGGISNASLLAGRDGIMRRAGAATLRPPAQPRPGRRSTSTATSAATSSGRPSHAFTRRVYGRPSACRPPDQSTCAPAAAPATLKRPEEFVDVAWPGPASNRRLCCRPRMQAPAGRPASILSAASHLVTRRHCGRANFSCQFCNTTHCKSLGPLRPRGPSDSSSSSSSNNNNNNNDNWLLSVLAPRGGMQLAK